MTKHIQEADLHAFVDDRLDEAGVEAVMVYLEANPVEMQRARDFLDHKQMLLKGLDAIAATGADPFTQELGNRLAERLARRSRPIRLRMAAATVLLVSLGWGAHALYRNAIDEQIPDIVEDAAQVHQIFAGDQRRAVEIPGSNADELVISFSQHLGEPLNVPDLTAIGFDLVGGRLLGTEEGPLVQILYENRQGGRLTVGISSQDTEADSIVEVVEVDGLNAGYWQNGDLVYTVVADISLEQLLSVAAEIGGLKPTGRL